MDMNALPEGCIANAISLTNPRDSCRLALVNSTFGSASHSDAVWERFLPSDYLDIIARSSNAGLDAIRSFSSKKEIFLYLCDNHFLIDDGKKSIWLDKWSGKKCYMLAPRDLYICWGDTPRYWEWINLPGSRFQEVAKLLDVCWLEICGKITTDKLSPNTTYVAYLVFSTKSDLQGFGQPPAVASFGIRGQDSGTVRVCLDPIAARERRPMRDPFARRRFWRFRPQPTVTGQEHTTEVDANEKCPVQRDDCWMEVELGEFHIEGTEAVELEMSLKEVKGGHWKSGLIIEGIEIKPKRVK